MLVTTPFYHASLRTIIASFGALFNNIRVERRDETDTIIQTIKVPFTYGPKEKWYTRLVQDPNAGNTSNDPEQVTQSPVQTVLPRMCYEIVALNYDFRRKGTSVVKDVRTITEGPTGPLDDPTRLMRTFKPIPIQLQFQVYVIAKTLTDSLSILEQILPWFNPDFTITVKSNTDIGLSYDVPIVLRYPIVPQDSYWGDFNERRDITWTLVFTIDTIMYGPAKAEKIINQADIRFLESEWPNNEVPYDNVNVKPYPNNAMPDDPFTFETTVSVVQPESTGP